MAMELVASFSFDGCSVLAGRDPDSGEEIVILNDRSIYINQGTSVDLNGKWGFYSINHKPLARCTDLDFSLRFLNKIENLIRKNNEESKGSNQDPLKLVSHIVTPDCVVMVARETTLGFTFPRNNEVVIVNDKIYINQGHEVEVDVENKGISINKKPLGECVPFKFFRPIMDLVEARKKLRASLEEAKPASPTSTLR